ncbi:hypothetical protein HZA40_01785 [Candidatus Peregrinibacteria bacterium]|nr:hypothetical protein [Candidatus Peregrinibacteria bacterium]
MGGNIESRVDGLKEKEKAKKPLDGLMNETAGDLVSSPKESSVNFSEENLQKKDIDPLMSLPFEQANWQNGEFLKQQIDELLLAWSADKQKLDSTTRAYSLEGLGKAGVILFFKIEIKDDRYYFDFTFRRADGTVKKYGLNFARRKEIFQAGGDVEFYLKQIVEKEEKAALNKREKPWHVAE